MNNQKDCSVEVTTDKSVGNRRQGRRKGKGKFLGRTPLMLEDSKEEISSSSEKRLMFPRRPGYGQLGTKCVVKANHFLAELADMELTQYSVSFQFLWFSKISFIFHRYLSDPCQFISLAVYFLYV